MEEVAPKKEKEWLERYFDQLGEVALELLEDGLSQRVDNIETDYSKDRLKKEGDNPLIQDKAILRKNTNNWKVLFQQRIDKVILIF